MQIFHNANYDFIRWRWHALILSSVVIIGGFALSLARGGVPLGIDFSGGTLVVAEVRAAGARRCGAARARQPARRQGRPAVRRSARTRDHDPAAADRQTRSRASTWSRARKARSTRIHKAGLPKFEIVSTEVVGPDHWRRPPAQGHLRDAGLDPRSDHLHRAAIPLHFRARRDRRDVPRHLHRLCDAGRSSITSCR